MGLQVIQGPPNSGRAGEVFSRFRAVLEHEPVLVVPTGDDVAEFERQLCGDAQGAALGGSISTFGALTAEVARALAVELPPTLTVPQRQALVRAAIRRADPGALRRSAGRPGFAPALDALIAELQAALISPREFEALVAELDDPGHEIDLARLYASYVELRDASGHADPGLVAEAAIAALRGDPEAWGGRPVLVYGFDDFGRAQLELLAGLARAAEVTVAVDYEDRGALAVRAPLLGALTSELGAERVLELPFDQTHTESRVLRHLDRNLFEPGAPPVPPDDGLVLMQSAGARGEAEAIGIEIARLLGSGYEPDEIVVVVRRPDSGGPLLATVLRELGLPVALEATLPLAATCVGGSLLQLCRAAADDGAVDALLAHLRSDPSFPPAIADSVERRVRRGDAQTVSAATEGWERPPRHLARVLEAQDARGRLRALARSARELAEGAHREGAPLTRPAADEDGGVPFSALELRAGVAAAELLDQLAAVGGLPGCEHPDLPEAVEALASASVPHWRGPAAGRVRIMSPYRARAARARALFCASLQDGEFPTATPQDPLLSEERRREIGSPDLRRTEQADEERYLFHACVSRPTERLYLSWQSTDEDGAALARSAFVDEVLDLVDPGPDADAEDLVRTRGLERAVPTPEEATSERGLARALALGGWHFDRPAALRRIGIEGALASRVLAPFAVLSDPDRLPGPLRAAPVLSELGSRTVFSANSLEGWIECPYRWFVSHELTPQLLEPEADPLWLGSLVHRALERLYRDPPGRDSIPRPGDVADWRRRFGELLEEEATQRAHAPLNRTRRAALDRARIQVDAFLDTEADAETDLRPATELLELGFGEFEEGEHEDGESEATASREPLALGEISLRGRIDRIDLAPDGHGAVVRDYKTGKQVSPAAKFTDEGTLQIQLYMLVAERVLGLDPIAGLYQPLGAVKDRRPRGIALCDDDRLDGLEIVRNDRCERDEVEAVLAEAERSASRAARQMREGLIDRRPIGGQCPKYCTYQSICRLERALGAVGEQKNGNGDDS